MKKMPVFSNLATLLQTQNGYRTKLHFYRSGMVARSFPFSEGGRATHDIRHSFFLSFFPIYIGCSTNTLSRAWPFRPRIVSQNGRKSDFRGEEKEEYHAEVCYTSRTWLSYGIWFLDMFAYTKTQVGQTLS
jgi:hypothetical protein